MAVTLSQPAFQAWYTLLTKWLGPIAELNILHEGLPKEIITASTVEAWFELLEIRRYGALRFAVVTTMDMEDHIVVRSHEMMQWESVVRDFIEKLLVEN